mmetsp:Transcript_22834/g.45885  ORF Transcript_22834/g.45885 Transcript_22834/m.45885 type:complete len:213 (-) Transcript_22834:157-795(-)
MPEFVLLEPLWPVRGYNRLIFSAEIFSLSSDLPRHFVSPLLAHSWRVPPHHSPIMTPQDSVTEPTKQKQFDETGRVVVNDRWEESADPPRQDFRENQQAQHAPFIPFPLLGCQLPFQPFQLLLLYCIVPPSRWFHKYWPWMRHCTQHRLGIWILLSEPLKSISTRVCFSSVEPFSVSVYCLTVFIHHGLKILWYFPSPTRDTRYLPVWIPVF